MVVNCVAVGVETHTDMGGENESGEGTRRKEGLVQRR